MRKTSILVVFGVALIMLSVPFVSAEQVHIQYKLPNNLASIPDWMHLWGNYTINSDHKLVLKQIPYSVNNAQKSFEILFKESPTVNEVIYRENYSMLLTHPIVFDMYEVWYAIHNDTSSNSWEKTANYFLLDNICFGFKEGNSNHTILKVENNLNTFVLGTHKSSGAGLVFVGARQSRKITILQKNTTGTTTKVLNGKSTYAQELITNTSDINQAQLYGYGMLNVSLYFKYTSNPENSTGIVYLFIQAELLINKGNGNIIKRTTTESYTYFTEPINGVLFLRDSNAITFSTATHITGTGGLDTFPITNNTPERTITINDLSMDVYYGNGGNTGGNNNGNNTGENSNPIIKLHKTTFSLVGGIGIMVGTIIADIYIFRKFP